jgi:hypothetical protein
MLAAYPAPAQTSAEKAIVQMEKDWLQALVTGDASVVERVEAADITNTGTEGNVTGKAKDVEDVRTRNLTAQAAELSDLKVRFYGKTAVATYTYTLTNGKYAGKDMSGRFRETDTWVESNGKWQVVACQENKIAQ